MYETMFSYQGVINDKTVLFIFLPDFRQSVTIISNGVDCKLFSDKEYTISEKAYGSEFRDVYAAQDAQWFAEEEFGNYLKFSVTGRTKEIKTEFGDDFNQKVNQLLKEARIKYTSEKRTNLRIYFYDVKKDKLTIPENAYYGYGYDSLYKYKVWHPGVDLFSIDNSYEKPKEDCFILGRVKKTVGTNKGKLIDFIEPVSQINLNFKREEFLFAGEYFDRVLDLAFELIELLLFTIKNEYEDDVYAKRIKAYLASKDSNFTYPGSFNEMVMEALKSGNLEMLRKLYNVRTTRQDCSKETFEIYLVEAVTCKPNKVFDIKYANGEDDCYCRDAEWVYNNKDRCTNAICVYLGNLRNEYQFDVVS